MKKSPINLIAIFLLSFWIFYLLITISEYNFFPINRYAINIAASIIILCLTVLSFIKKCAKTPLTSLFSMFLPLIAVLYFTAKSFATDSDSNDTNTSTIHYLMTYLCCLVIFFSSGLDKQIKIGFGIIYFLLLIPILLKAFIVIAFGDFSRDTVVKSEMSPNSVYLAEIIDNDQGALGGNTYVDITRQKDVLNILIGKLKKKPKCVYSGRWGEFEGMTLRWETDQILYINEKQYIIGIE